MNQQRQGFLQLLPLLGLFSVFMPLAVAQTSNTTASAVVKRTMAAVPARCHRTVNGVRMITFIPASDDEFETIKSLGSGAIEPLSTYLDAKVPDGFTQLFAVKFLTALRDPAALGALQRAFSQDQWEVTRMAALDGMFATSQTAAKPYVEAALEDKSAVVRHLAERLRTLYEPPKSDR
jgi:hypothetical protein